jgi:hypothetical protein
VSCTHTKVFNSPSGKFSVKYATDEEERWIYTVSDSEGHNWGRITSVITDETRRIRRSDDSDQQIIWSTSESTALIYENISDASPSYRHILVRFDYDQKKFKSYQLDLGIRRVSEDDIYGHWPSIRYLTDTEIGLSWLSEPKESDFDIDVYLNAFRKRVESNLSPDSPIY